MISEEAMKQFTDEDADKLTEIVMDLAPKWDKSIYDTYNFIKSLISRGGRLEIIINSYDKYGLDGLLQYGKVLYFKNIERGALSNGRI